MADIVTFIENRRKDRVLIRVTDAVPLEVLEFIGGILDGRLCQPAPKNSVRVTGDSYLVSVPVPDGKNKHFVRRSIRAAGKPVQKPVLSSSKRIVAGVGTSTRSYVGRRSQGN